MARKENLKYNLVTELSNADERLTGSNSLIGMTALTNSQYNNSARSVMNTSHLKQFVDLLEPEFPNTFTGGENLVGKFGSAYKQVNNPTKVVAKIVKYEDILDEPTKYFLFVYDTKTKMYDVILREEYKNLTEVYGYKNNNAMIDSLNVDDTIEAGTVLFSSSSYDEDMNYGYGKNIDISFTTDPYTIEDACVVCESLAKNMMSNEVVSYELGINENDFLINLYGDNKNYQPFPNIGEYAEGLVAAKRTLFTNQLLVDFKDSELSKIHDSDIQLYIEGVGKVIDIDIYCNNPDIEETPFNAQIIKYYKSQNKFYKKIVKTCEKIMDKCVGIHKKSHTDRTFSHNLDYLYKRAKEFLDEESKWKDNDNAFSNLQIHLDIVRPSKLQLGQKIVARSGNKSVIAQIRPDEEMQYIKEDKYEIQPDGSIKKTEIKKRVQLHYSICGICNRTTGFVLNELEINFITRKLQLYLWEMLYQESLKKRKRDITKKQADFMFEILDILSPNFSKQQRKIFDNLDKDGQYKYMQDCLNDRIYVCQPPMWEDGKEFFYKALELREKYPFLCESDQFYVEKWGREIPTLRKGSFASMYFMKLKQTPIKGFSVRGSGAINNKGLPEKSHRNKIHTEKYSSTAIRFGEFETGNFAIGVNTEDLALLHAFYRTAKQARGDLSRYLLTGEEGMFKLKKKYRQRTAEIFQVYLKSLGVELEFVEEGNELQELDNKILRIYEFEGKDYLCTEYGFMLVKRRKAAEKAILSQSPVIDGDEFEKQVMQLLKSTNYILGPDKNDYDKEPGLWPDTVVD